MATAIEQGTVKFFDVREPKRFGFLKLESGEEIFFHYHDQVVGGRSLGWEQTFPKPGDVIFFVRSNGQRGTKASPWVTAENVHLLRREVEVQARSSWFSRTYVPERRSAPVPTIRYRLMVQVSHPSTGHKDEPKPLWEGTNLKDPSLKVHWDAKYDRPTFSCSDFDSRKWWERKDGETWLVCYDPTV